MTKDEQLKVDELQRRNEIGDIRKVHDGTVINGEARCEGFLVQNVKFGTETHFSTERFHELSASDIAIHTHQGRNIEQMTRVTGYFSKISGWNKGKQGELKDRRITKEFGA